MAAPIGVAGFVVALTWRTGESPPSPTRNHGRPFTVDASVPVGGEARAPDLLRFGWRAGTWFRYRFAWWYNSETRVAAIPTPLGGDGELSGELVLRSHGDVGGHLLVEVSLKKIERIRLRTLGKEILSGTGNEAARLFEGRSVFVEMSARGVLQRFRFRSEDSTTVKQLMQALVYEIQVSLPAAEEREWVATEFSSYGETEARYSRERRESGWRLVRQDRRRREKAPIGAVGSQRVEAAGWARIAPDLSVAALSRDLDVREGGASRDGLTATSSFTMDLVERGRFDPAPVDIDRLESRRPGESVPDPEMRRRITERVAGDMTISDILLGVDTSSRDVPREKGWMTRATAYLRLHPGELDELARAFLDPHAKPRGRALVMDLLASAGDAKAQDVMRRLLDEVEGRTDGVEFVLLLQRFTLVSRPARESAAFLLRAYDEVIRPEKRDKHFAAAYSLGAVTRRLSLGGDAALARSVNDRLRRDFERAESQEERRALVAALGNAGFPENFESIRSAARAERADIRHQAARSLGVFKTQAARESLFDLIVDREASVSIEALRNLSQWEVRAGDVARLASLVDAEKLPRSAYPTLVQLLSLHRDKNPAVATRILRTLLARATDDPELVAQIRALLPAPGLRRTK